MISLFSLRFHTNTHLYSTNFTSLCVWTAGPKTSNFVNELNFVYITSFCFGQSFLCWYSSNVTYWALTIFRYLCPFMGFLHYFCLFWDYRFINCRLISHFDGLFQSAKFSLCSSIPGSYILWADRSTTL